MTSRRGDLRQIRILMTAMPHLLHEIVETMVTSQPDMASAGCVRRSESVAEAARRVRADLVILGENHEGADGAPWDVLNEYPRLKLLTISSDGHRATRYELRPHQVVIDEISPENLIGAIRAAMDEE
jgi:DNA-binding NarL/FixJ family response regulator